MCGEKPRSPLPSRIVFDQRERLSGAEPHGLLNPWPHFLFQPIDDDVALPIVIEREDVRGDLGTPAIPFASIIINDDFHRRLPPATRTPHRFIPVRRSI